MSRDASPLDIVDQLIGRELDCRDSSALQRECREAWGCGCPTCVRAYLAECVALTDATSSALDQLVQRARARLQRCPR